MLQVKRCKRFPEMTTSFDSKNALFVTVFKVPIDTLLGASKHTAAVST